MWKIVIVIKDSSIWTFGMRRRHDRLLWQIRRNLPCLRLFSFWSWMFTSGLGPLAPWPLPHYKSSLHVAFTKGFLCLTSENVLPTYESWPGNWQNQSCALQLESLENSKKNFRQPKVTATILLGAWINPFYYKATWLVVMFLAGSKVLNILWLYSYTSSRQCEGFSGICV